MKFKIEDLRDQTPTPAPGVSPREEKLPADCTPWSRQPGENEEEWEKFKAYRDSTKPRKLLRPGVGNWGSMCDLAAKWRWYERVAAMDRWISSVADSEIEAQTRMSAKERSAQWLGLCQDARDLVSMELQRLLERAKASSVDGTIKPEAMIRLLEVAFKAERLLHEESTENVRDNSGLDLSGMTADELRKAVELAEKMAPVH